MKRITVRLAEDHTVVREGIRKLLESERDLKLVGEAQTGRQTVALVKKISSRRGRDGHRDAAAQWFRSHPANSQSRPQHQSAHAPGAP